MVEHAPSGNDDPHETAVGRQVNASAIDPKPRAAFQLGFCGQMIHYSQLYDLYFPEFLDAHEGVFFALDEMGAAINDLTDVANAIQVIEFRKLIRDVRSRYQALLAPVITPQGSERPLRPDDHTEELRQDLCLLAAAVVTAHEDLNPWYRLGVAVGLCYVAEIETEEGCELPSLQLVVERALQINPEHIQNVPLLSRVAELVSTLQEVGVAHFLCNAVSGPHGDAFSSRIVTGANGTPIIFSALRRFTNQLLDELIVLPSLRRSTNGSTLDTSASAPTTPAVPPKVRLKVYPDEPAKAVLDDEPFPLNRYCALYLQALLEANGDWMGPKDLVQKYPELDSIRPDRLAKTLPPRLQELVHLAPAKGSRMLMAKLA